MLVLNHKEDVHFCTREWVSLSHYWRASANMGETTRQLWVRRLANSGRDSPIIGEATHQLLGCYTLIISVWPLNYIVYYKPMIGKSTLIIGV